jgi:hypothetical protein
MSPSPSGDTPGLLMYFYERLVKSDGYLAKRVTVTLDLTYYCCFHRLYRRQEVRQQIPAIAGVTTIK